MNRQNTWRSACVVAASLAIAMIAGCDSDSNSTAKMKENSGSSLNTSAGQQLYESMFLGKWDVDGERTNTANGNGGVSAVPSDITKDILGKGWKFETGGVLKTDQAVGTKKGTWRIDGTNTLTVQEGGQPEPYHYETSFRDGYMYLRRADGKYIVFERDKYFGF